MLQIRRILVPTDFSECARQALDRAADLAEAFGADLVLLNVIELPAGLPSSVPTQADADMPIQPLLDHLEQTALQQLRAVARTVERRRLPVSYRVEKGPVDRNILEVADRVEADLIAIGTHGRRGWRHLLLGSVTERVIRQAKIPVLTIRAPEAG